MIPAAGGAGAGRTRLRPPWARAIAVCLALASIAGGFGRGAAAAPGFTGLSELRPIYDDILNAQFASVDAGIARASGATPPEACQVLAATNLWWRIVLDPADRQFDSAFTDQVTAAIDAAERWTAREPGRAEAWFYLGAAYGARVSWRVQRGERIAAARDGKRIKEALERALEIEPAMADARFGIGLYKYYADIAPAAAKFLRFLLLLPGGDRVAGLRDMEAASARGTLIEGEAQYQLHWIYLWYEHQPVRGLNLLQQLVSRYPDNPHFLQRVAQVHAQYFHDAAASLAAWRQLIDRAPHMAVPVLAEVLGRLGAADQLDVLYETDRAVEELRRVVALRPATPVGALARTNLQLGQALDRLGRRAGATAALRAALADAKARDDEDLVGRIEAALNRSTDQAHGAAYRLSLSGWRALEHGAPRDAEEKLADASAQAPGDWVIRVRLGRARAVRGKVDAALEDFNRAIAARPQVPPVALQAAYLWSAELLAARGAREEAMRRYGQVTRVFGGDSRMVTDAARAMARLAR